MKKNENRTKFPKVIEGSRTCVDCGSYNTIMKRWKGGFAPQWYAANEEKTQWRCRKCWNRFRSFL